MIFQYLYLARGSFLTIVAAIIFSTVQGQNKAPTSPLEDMQKNALQNAPLPKDLAVTGQAIRFVAKKAVPAVVTIRYFSAARNEFLNLFERLFGDTPYPAPQDTSHYVGSASGVLITPNGYIITNHHVVEQTDSLIIELPDLRRYKAKLVGSDPSTDIALLKIDDTGLPFIAFGSSDSVEVGDQVVTIGNPMELASTVTAGILSAKARSLNLISAPAAIESYLQTDASVTFGNSGGALLDIEGRLIGITAAISTFISDYAGYCFAIPVEIARKVADDLLRYGKLMRGFLGIQAHQIRPGEAATGSARPAAGVAIDSIQIDGAAFRAGLKVKDIITEVNGHKIITLAHLLGVLARYSPDDVVRITIFRNQQMLNLNVKLLAAMETAQGAQRGREILKSLGLEMANLDYAEKKKLKLTGGAKVLRISRGEISDNTTMKSGFIITRINNVPVNNTEELAVQLSQKKGLLIAEGIYPDSEKIYYFEIRVEGTPFF